MALFGRSQMNSERDEELNRRDRNRADRKRRNIVRSAHEPLIPFICRILFILMIGVLCIDVFMEIVTHALGRNPAAGASLAGTIFWSALVIWLFFGVPLLILADIQLVRIWKFGYVEKKYYFRDEISGEADRNGYEPVEQPEIDMEKSPELRLYAKNVGEEARKRYLRYVVITGVGTLILAVGYLVCTKIR